MKARSVFQKQKMIHLEWKQYQFPSYPRMKAIFRNLMDENNVQQFTFESSDYSSKQGWAALR